MKLEKFKLNKNCIYESQNQSLNTKALTAMIMGIPFVKHSGEYYKVTFKEYKSKPMELNIHMVDVEIV